MYQLHLFINYEYCFGFMNTTLLGLVKLNYCVMIIRTVAMHQHKNGKRTFNFVDSAIYRFLELSSSRVITCL